MSDQLERIVQINGAFDKRHEDPKRNYGIHGMELRFVLKGEHGAVQFVVYTNIHLDHIARELWETHRDGPYDYALSRPMGADIGYHARTPQYEGQTAMKCEYLGGQCFYDGSTLRAEEFMPEFIAGGSDAVWAMLEQEYAHRFTPAEVAP